MKLGISCTSNHSEHPRAPEYALRFHFVTFYANVPLYKIRFKKMYLLVFKMTDGPFYNSNYFFLDYDFHTWIRNQTFIFNIFFCSFFDKVNRILMINSVQL